MSGDRIHFTATIPHGGEQDPPVGHRPVSEDGIIVAGSSYEKQAILGIKLAGASGDINSKEQVSWIKRRDTPYAPSLLLYKGLPSPRRKKPYPSGELVALLPESREKR